MVGASVRTTCNPWRSACSARGANIRRRLHVQSHNGHSDIDMDGQTPRRAPPLRRQSPQKRALLPYPWVGDGPPGQAVGPVPLWGFGQLLNAVSCIVLHRTFEIRTALVEIFER